MMNSLHADLARAVIDARRAETSARRLTTDTRRSRPRTTRAVPEREHGRWLRGLRRRGSVGTDPASATPTPLPRPTLITRRTPPAAAVALDAMLALVAERIVEHGTATEARLLQHLSDAVSHAAPGAAAALVDWEGAEVARLRAFGVVHGVVLAGLAPRAQSSLLDDILGTDLSLAG